MATIFRLPDIGEGLTEAEIVEWHAEVGDEVVADRALVTVETDKTQADLPAPVTGTLLHRGAADGSMLEVGAVLAVIGKPGEAWQERADDDDWGLVAQPEVEPEPAEGPAGASGPLALPLVRRMARELGIDLSTIAGSGPGGRITRDDVQRAADVPAERPPLVGTLDEVAEDLSAPPPVEAPAQPPAPSGEDRLVPLSATRRAIAEHMVRSWTEIPHVTTFAQFDATRLLDVRRALSARHGAAIPLDALIAKAVVPAIVAHPEFNATLRDDGLLLHGAVDMGVAMDSDDGLLVAVVRNAAARPLLDLAREIGSLAERAKDRTLRREEMTGSTFTVSNIGAVGGTQGTPLIPYGTTAILSVGRAVDAPVVRDGELAVSKVAPLSLSYDHRVIDGALGRRFMDLVVENLQEPALFLA
jgi:pyruvate dehydrogenase E2 component (dihydrolipoamide acetyltransferase)